MVAYANEFVWGEGLDATDLGDGRVQIDSTGGPQGATGAAGGTGATGATGWAGGAVTIPFTFSTTTTDSDPGSGNLRLGNATQNAAAVIRADLLDANGADRTTILDSFDDSSNPTVKGHIRLFKTSDPTAFLLFTVSAIATPSGYRNITVANVGSSSSSPFANGDAITLCFTRAGDQGATGAGSGPGADGWQDATTETWTYASATSFTIASVDKTAQFPKGSYLRLKQGGAYKYFVVTSSSFSTNTTINITGGSDYTLANSAITDNYYSYQADPQGWPGWFNYTPTATGLSGALSINAAKFSVVGRICVVRLDVFGTSNATTFTVTEPITIANVGVQATFIFDNGASAAAAGRVDGVSNFRFGKTYAAAGGFTGANTKGIACEIVYEI